jgi:hypothetical protein
MAERRSFRMRRVVLLLFAIIALFGIAIAGWANLGDSSLIAGIGGVHEVLRTHGQAENVALRNDLYAAVLRMQWPWDVVQWLGFGVITVSVIGIALVWRSRES